MCIFRRFAKLSVNRLFERLFFFAPAKQEEMVTLFKVYVETIQASERQKSLADQQGVAGAGPGELERKGEPEVVTVDPVSGTKCLLSAFKVGSFRATPWS